MTQLSSGLLPTDDDGSGTTGTKQNQSFWSLWRDAINTLIHSVTNPTITPEDIIDEVVTARGNKATLDTRLDVSIDNDGAYKSVGKMLALETNVNGAQGNLSTIDGRLSVTLDDDGYINNPYAKQIKHSAGTSGSTGSTGPAPVRVAVDYTVRNNLLVAETDAHSFTLKGGSLDEDGDMLHYRARGTLANTANLKTLKFKFGAAVVTALSAVATANVAWSLDVVVQRTGAATQLLYGEIKVGTTVSVIAAVAGTETLSGDITCKVTLQSNTASSDLFQSLGVADIE